MSVNNLSSKVFPDDWHGGEWKVALDDHGAEGEDKDGVDGDGWPSAEM